MADMIATRDAFRGLLIPDPRVTLDPGQTTVTQAGPLPGVPVAQTDTEMVLVAGGSQAAAQELRVRALAAGMPGILDSDAGIVWKYEGDAMERGWDPPTAISHWESVFWVGPATAVQPAYPHAITLADGTILVAYGAEYSLGSADAVYVRSRDPETGVWSAAVQPFQHGGYFSAWVQAHPCMVALPSGRVLLFHWVELASGSCQVQMRYSDDQGATWAIGATHVLPEPVAYAAAASGAAGYDQFGRLRAAYLDGDIILVASLRRANTNVGASEYRDTLRQYSSSSLGTRFALVDEPAIGASQQDYFGVCPDLAVVGGQVVMAWGSLGNGSFATCVRLASGNDPYTEQDIITIDGVREPVDDVAAPVSGRQSAKADLTLVVDDNGNVYAYYPSVLQTWTWYTSRSQDGGATWEITKNSTGWWGTSDASTTISRAAATWCQGRAVLLHQWDASPGTNDSSIGAVYLGGWTTVTQPPLEESYVSADRMGYHQTWLPFDVPSDMVIWVATTAGTYTETLSSGGLVLTTTVGTVLYEDNPVGTVDQGIEARLALETTTSTTASDAVVCWLRLADGAQEYLVRVRIGTSEIVFRDVHGGGNVGTVTMDVTAGVDLKIAMRGTSLRVWYRARSSDSDREYVAGPTTDALADGGAGAANNLIQWGHEAGSTAASKWYEVSYMSGLVTGAGSTGLTFPNDLTPCHISSSPLYVDGGVTVRAVDGPAYHSDEWNIDTRYSYELSRCLSTGPASPRIRWRSTGETQQTITLALDEGLVAMAQQAGNVMIGVAFLGCKGVRTGSIRGRNAAGAYSTITTYDAATDLADLDYTRSGNTVDSTTGGIDAPYLYTNEAAGWSVDLGGGFLRRVAWSTAGKWAGPATGKLPHLHLEGVTDSEPASGTLALVPSDFIVLTRVNFTPYRALQVVIDAQDTVDGYFEIGSLVVGFVEIHGDEVSWGRIIETSPNVERSIARDGTDRVRVAGPPVRTVQYAWSDGVYMTPALGAEPTPDWLSTSTTAGSRAAASIGDTPYQMDGLVRLLDGARIPLVYLPSIPKGSTGNDTIILNRRHQFVYGRLTSPVRIETVQGDELDDEVVRVAQIQIEELT